MSNPRISLLAVLFSVLLAGAASGALSITFDWNVSGGQFVQASDTASYTFTLNLIANSGTTTLEEGQSLDVPFQEFNWSVSPNATGSLVMPIDRSLTIDGMDQTIDQDVSFASNFISLFGGNVKNGTFFQPPVLNYDFGDRGIVDVSLIQSSILNGLGTTGTSGVGTFGNNAIVVRFTAHDIVVPEPSSLPLLAIATLIGLSRRRIL